MKKLNDDHELMQQFVESIAEVFRANLGARPELLVIIAVIDGKACTVIGGHEQYMSPENFEKLLSEALQKIPGGRMQ